MADRRAHPDPDTEAVLAEAEEHQWNVDTGPKDYVFIQCSCPTGHYKYVTLAPTEVEFARGLRDWLGEQPCW